MPSFETDFQKSGGKPITYKGKTLRLFDSFSVSPGETLHCIFESWTSRWRQGCVLSADGEGGLVASGVDCGRICLLWTDSSPTRVDVSVVGSLDHVLIYNVYDVGNGITARGGNGAAMIVEEVPNGKRYRCNDAFPDDDFADIIFRIERNPLNT